MMNPKHSRTRHIHDIFRIIYHTHIDNLKILQIYHQDRFAGLCHYQHMSRMDLICVIGNLSYVARKYMNLEQ